MKKSVKTEELERNSKSELKYLNAKCLSKYNKTTMSI